MSWAAEIAQAKRELLAYCKMALSQLFLYTLSAKASAIGDQDSIQAGDGSQNQQSVIRISPFGLRSVPPKNIRSLSIRLGASNIFYIGIGPTTAYGPQDLGDGDAALYSKGAAELRATGDDLVANGGTAKVGRVGDDVDVGTFSFTFTPATGTGVVSGGAAVLTWTPPGGGTPVTITSGSDLTGKISSGADHFKG